MEFPRFKKKKKQIRLIVGLGNPGKKFKNTMHNIGFEIVDRLAKDHCSGEFEDDYRFKAEIIENTTEDRQARGMIIFAKPQTYMNLSGESVHLLKKHYDLKNEDILIIHDDVDLDFKTHRLVASAGSAGHRGVQSVIDWLKTKEIPRLRVGIKRVEAPHKVDYYVLQRFPKSLRDKVRTVVEQWALIAESWLNDGLTKAMNVWNGVKGA